MQNLNAVVDGAKAKFAEGELKSAEMEANMKQVYEKTLEMESNIKQVYIEAMAKFGQMDEVIDKMKDSTRTEGRDGKGKCGFLPDKMMVPKAFSDDVGTWRK